MKLFSLPGGEGEAVAEQTLPGDASFDAQFESILVSYGAFLRAAIRRFCPGELAAQAADIEQQARIKLWRALQSEKEIRNLSSYVYRIAATTTIDAVRHAKALREEQLRMAGEEDETGRVTQLPASSEASPEARAVDRDRLEKVQHALASLAENRRRAVQLYLQGMPFQEVARLLGWSDGKARNLIYRGLEDLRQELRKLGIEGAAR